MRFGLWVHDGLIAAAVLWCSVNGGWSTMAWVLSWALLTGVVRIIDPFGWRDLETIMWAIGLFIAAEFVWLMIFWRDIIDFIVRHY